MVDQAKLVKKLFEGVGKVFVHLETRDGIHREGKLTGIRCRTILHNGGNVDLLDEMELNGDPTDTVSMDSIARLDVE